MTIIWTTVSSTISMYRSNEKVKENSETIIWAQNDWGFLDTHTKSLVD